LHGLQQKFRALIGRQQAKIDEDRAIGGQAQLAAQHIQPFHRQLAPRAKGGRIDTVGQGVDALRRDREPLDQLVTCLSRAGQNSLRLAVDPSLQAAQWWQQGRACAEKAVIQHLFGQTALIVEDQRRAQSAAQQRAQQRAFVQVGVDQVRTATGEAQRGGGQQRAQQPVQQQLAP